jgi:hypothetical protein
MYDNLVKRLREPCQYENCILCQQAADAIDALTAYVRQIEGLRKDGYYLHKTKMSTYRQAIMTMPLPEPPKEG